MSAAHIFPIYSRKDGPSYPLHGGQEAVPLDKYMHPAVDHMKSHIYLDHWENEWPEYKPVIPNSSTSL